MFKFRVEYLPANMVKKSSEQGTTVPNAFLILINDEMTNEIKIKRIKISNLLLLKELDRSSTVLI